MSSRVEALISFIRSELLGDREGVVLDADSDLLGSGLLDSLAVMRLVAHLERDRGITIAPADITIENFMTVGRVVEYLDSLEGGDAQRRDL